MKPSKKVFLLTGLVSAIVIFWLLPGINTANHVRYTRKYEDTDRNAALLHLLDTTKSKKPVVAQKEAEREITYKTESIEEDMKLSDVDAKMYSRAIHYEEEILLEVPLVVEDTVLQLNLEVEDTVYAALDTLTVQQ